VRLPEANAQTHSWPRITVVTPSFNQGQFIEETIRSILLQGYPNLEYFVLDGGSTDNTADVLEKYSRWFDFCVSEPDRGQSAAINRGLRMGSGLYATWINSDDLLCRDALSNHFLNHQPEPAVVYVGDCLNIDQAGQILFTQRGQITSLEDLLRIRSVWTAGNYISQQAVLFPLSLANRVGGLNEENHYSMDYELWGRFLLAGAELRYTRILFGCFRRQEAQKTSDIAKQTASTLDVAEALLAATKSIPPSAKQEILADLQAYREEYPKILWEHTGRLARLGLPPSIVTPIRTVKKTLGRAFKVS
jgi:glycosyltransferase involved in cell wall biosynthesis